MFIAMSLDGFIATEDEQLDWLYSVEGEGDNGYGKFMEQVDCVLIGRKTYDWIRRESPNEFPYKDQTCYVFSRTPRSKRNM